jgi:hypothetical protein
VDSIQNRTDEAVILAIMEGQCINIGTANQAKPTLK